MNQYQIRRPDKTDAYPRAFLSDSGEEYFDAMDRGTYGQSIEAEIFWQILGDEARAWLLKAGYSPAEFTGLDFTTRQIPQVYSLVNNKPRDNQGDKPPLEV